MQPRKKYKWMVTLAPADNLKESGTHEIENYWSPKHDMIHAWVANAAVAEVNYAMKGRKFAVQAIEQL